MNLSKQGDHILRRSEVELDDGVNAIFDWHSRSIMVKDVLIEIGVVVVSMSLRNEIIISARRT